MPLAKTLFTDNILHTYPEITVFDSAGVAVSLGAGAQHTQYARPLLVFLDHCGATVRRRQSLLDRNFCLRMVLDR